VSAQILSDRAMRRIAASTGLDLACAWGHGGYIMRFVTADHRHGWWDKKTGEWGYEDAPMHYASCRELFPEADGEIGA
jgi:nitric oxide reductase large subunit